MPQRVDLGNVVGPAGPQGPEGTITPELEALKNEVITYKTEAEQAATDAQQDYTSTNARIDAIVTSSDNPSIDEVVDARVGVEWNTFASLGDHVRDHDTIRKQMASGITAGNYGRQFTDCTPVIGSDLEVQVRRQRNMKNLFNKDDTSQVINATFTASSMVIGSDANGRTIFVSCSPNTTYTISKLAGGGRFFLGWTEDSNIPTIGTQVYGIVSNNTATSLSITTGANAKYIVSYIWLLSASTVTDQEIIDSVQIEIGSVATPYEPYDDGKTMLYHSGKNLGITNRQTLTRNGITFSINQDMSISLSGISTSPVDNSMTTLFDLPDNITLTISGGINNNIKVIISEVGPNNEWLSKSWESGNNSVTFTTLKKSSTNKYRMYVRVMAAGIDTSGVTIYPQLELGSVRTKYEQFISFTQYEIPNFVYKTIPSISGKNYLFTDREDSSVFVEYHNDTNKFNDSAFATGIGTYDGDNIAVVEGAIDNSLLMFESVIGPPTQDGVPSPDSPVEIKGVNKLFFRHISTYNLCPYRKAANGVTHNGDGTANWNFSQMDATYEDEHVWVPKGTYHFTVELQNTFSGTPAIELFRSRDNLEEISMGQFNLNAGQTVVYDDTFTLDEGQVIFIKVYKNDAVGAVKYIPTLVKGTESKPFKQVLHSWIVKDLDETIYAGIVDRKVDNTIATIHLTYKSFTIDGINNFVTQGQTSSPNENRFFANVPSNILNPSSNDDLADMLSNMYEVGTASNTFRREKTCIAKEASGSNIVIYDSERSAYTASQFNEFLSSNPLTIVYRLANMVDKQVELCKLPSSKNIIGVDYAYSNLTRTDMYATLSAGTGTGSGGIEEAPIDGKIYGRKNASWSEVVSEEIDSVIKILCRYDTYDALVSDHPTGLAGDSYVVGSDLYTWNEADSAWLNLGPWVGPPGQDGVDGKPGQDGTGMPIDGDVGSVPVKTDVSSASYSSRMLTKSDVGLSEVDNISDMDKPISNNMQLALNGKADINHLHPNYENRITALENELDGVELLLSEL